MEGTRRGTAQEECGHGDSESRLAVPEPDRAMAMGSGWFGVCLPIKAAAVHGVGRVRISERRHEAVSVALGSGGAFMKRCLRKAGNPRQTISRSAAIAAKISPMKRRSMLI